MTTLNLTLVSSPLSVSADARIWLWTPDPGVWSLVAETTLAVGVPFPFTVAGSPAVVLPPAPIVAVPAGSGGSEVLPGVCAPGTPGSNYDPRFPDSPTYTAAGLPPPGPNPTATPLSVFVLNVAPKSGVYVFTCA